MGDSKTLKLCKTSELTEVINFPSNQFNFYGFPEKNKADNGGAFIMTENK